MSDPKCIVFAVDDDPDLLGSAGYTAKTFGSPTEFLQAERPDIPAYLLFELSYPDFGGLDLQRDLTKSSHRVSRLIERWSECTVFENFRLLLLSVGARSRSDTATLIPEGGAARADPMTGTVQRGLIGLRRAV